MVDKNQNLLVTEYQNVVVIEPNVVVDSLGNKNERLLNNEDLVMYANLTCKTQPRTRLIQNPSGNFDIQQVSIGEINFLKQGNQDYLDESYTDVFTGLNTSNGDGNSQTNNLLLISQINIETTQNLTTPLITIIFEDIRGRALFDKGENSPYAVFFMQPYPAFYLTIKGYLGKAVTYEITISEWTASFNTQTGNFKITAKFVPYGFTILNSISLSYIKSAPYMYEKIYDIAPANDSQTFQSQLTNGLSNLQTKNSYTTFIGYEKLKEVYGVYKSKGLIPKNFPELTIKELIYKLETIEKNLAGLLNKQDMSSLTDAENYLTLLNNYYEAICSATDSWYNKNIDTDNFFILNNSSSDKVYTLKKNILESNNRDTVMTTLSGLITQYNKSLTNNATFGTNSDSTIQITVANKPLSIQAIKNAISFETLNVNINNTDIDWEKTYTKRTGKTINPQSSTLNNVQYEKFIAENTQLLNPIINDNQPKMSYWFKFDTFQGLIDTMKVQLKNNISKIDDILSNYLSERFEDFSLLGFKPLVKYIVAIIFANTETFLRLLCDVHSKAFDQRENKVRTNVILNDSKNNGIKNIVYPWPQYWIENVSSDIRFSTMYPGDPSVINLTKGYDYKIWPEVEFVEEHLKGLLITKENINTFLKSPNLQQNINKVSINALDYPNNTNIFENKDNVKYLFEIYDRMNMYSDYSRINQFGAQNTISDILADSEFINTQNSLGGDSPNLTKILKNYLLSPLNILSALENFSNSGHGDSWQKYLNGILVTDYIQTNVNNSFAIYDKSIMDGNVKITSSLPNNFNKLKEFIKSKNINVFNVLDTSPFNLPDWYKTNMANGVTANETNFYNTSNTYFIHTDKTVISNFDVDTKITQIRPITNFNFYNPTTPTIDGSTATSFKIFYDNRTLDSNIGLLQPTEGKIEYLNYSGNISNIQTTSLLNTPFFINSIIDGVNNWQNGQENPFITSAYLFLNSLPIATLREKYKTYDVGTTTTSDLDYIFASLKKFGAIHKIPYAWILKYGSIWHRYKKWAQGGEDILDRVWGNFNAIGQYDPITNDRTKIYDLNISTINYTKIVLEEIIPTPLGSLTEINTGFYPGLINTFNLFYRGKNLFTTYSNSEIQNQINSSSGFTICSTSNSAINYPAGYNPNQITDSLSLKTWSCTLVDKNNNIEYIVPSFGSVLNQVKYECFDNNNKLIVPLVSNSAVYNGSVRTIWGLPNYGYFDQSQILKPTPQEYLKKIFSGQTQQEAFSLRKEDDYTSIDELFSIFNKDILDIFETEFLNFSKTIYNYTNNISDANLSANITQIKVDGKFMYKNFQSLLTQIMKVNYVDVSNNANNKIIKLNEEQLTNFNNVIKGFLEYDVIMKYGNPGNFDRKLIDSFIPKPTPNERLYKFNPYFYDSLPTNNIGGITLPLSQLLYSDAWKALFTYVGFSNVNNLNYSDSGSYITDFFPDMNIEFTADNVQLLAPLIKMYATQKTQNPSLNKESFTSKLNNLTSDNKSFTDNVMNQYFNKVRTNLPNINDVVQNKNNTKLQGDVTKFELWSYFKRINDDWISGYDFNQKTLFEDVLFIDNGNRNIGDKVYFDPIDVKDKLITFFENPINDKTTILGILTEIGKPNFRPTSHVAYVNYYGANSILDNNLTKIDTSSNISNTLFGTNMSVDVRDSTTKFVYHLANLPSTYGSTPNKVDYVDDSFDLRDASLCPFIDNQIDKKDFYQSNRVVGFNVNATNRKQTIFTNLDISMDSGKQTQQVVDQILHLGDQHSGRQVTTQNQSQWDIYRNRSYTCKVNTIGNALIQPTMYFNLVNLPMFSGTYRIENVKHNITPGKFDTEFYGIRQRIYDTPLINNYLQTLTKELFTNLVNKIKQQTDCNPKDNSITNENPNSIVNTTTNNNITNNSGINPGPNTGIADNSQNGQANLVTPFLNYIPATQTQTSMSANEMAFKITNSVQAPMLGLEKVTNINNLTNTKVITFVTLYMESFNNNQFTTFNNNYGGAKLNYAWPGNLGNFFNKEYLTRLDANGKSNPYATFTTPENSISMIVSKWGPRSNTFTLDPVSISKTWIKNWSGLFAYGKSMTDKQFDDFITTNPDLYQNILNRVTLAIDLAKTLGLVDIYV